MVFYTILHLAKKLILASVRLSDLNTVVKLPLNSLKEREIFAGVIACAAYFQIETHSELLF